MVGCGSRLKFTPWHNRHGVKILVKMSDTSEVPNVVVSTKTCFGNWLTQLQRKIGETQRCHDIMNLELKRKFEHLHKWALFSSKVEQISLVCSNYMFAFLSITNKGNEVKKAMTPPEAILSYLTFFQGFKNHYRNYYHMQVHKAWLINVVQYAFEKSARLYMYVMLFSYSVEGEL